MNAFTFCTDTFSDLYKDVNGFRPRGHEFYALETTDARRQEIWDQYVQMLDAVFAEDDHQQELDRREHEMAVFSTIAAGAGDTETAERWLESADDQYWDVCPGRA